MHLVHLLGGWPGGQIARQHFRHQPVKPPFQSLVLATVIGNIAGIGGLWSTDNRIELARLLGA